MAEVLKSLNLLDSLRESLDNNQLAEVRETLEDLLISRLNLAVLGPRGAQKAALLNALRGLGPDDEGSAPWPSPSDQEELAVHPSPKHPDYRLWDLPAVPPDVTFDPEGYMERVKFSRYNAVLMASGGVVGGNEAAVFQAARQAGRETLYVTLLAGEGEGEAEREERRGRSLEVLTAAGVALPKVYVVSPRALERLDFPGLLEDLSRDLPELRAQALLLALPPLTPALVAQKKEVFKTLVWAAASLSGGVSALPVPLVASMVDASIGVRILSRARESLCLDDESVERLARQRGASPARLKALRSCSLSSEVTKGEVKKRLAAADKELNSGATWLAQMAMPRHARCASRSYNAMMKALSAAIDDMGDDADKILAVAIGH